MDSYPRGLTSWRLDLLFDLLVRESVVMGNLSVEIEESGLVGCLPRSIVPPTWSM